MLKINKHIEIVSSTRPVLSSMSRESREGARYALSKTYRKVGIRIVNSTKDLARLAADKPDLILLGMKYLPASSDEDWRTPSKVWISEYLDQHNLAYTGSNRLAHELEVDKAAAKQRVLGAGLKTAPFYVIKQNQEPPASTERIKYPLFIKPLDRGAGVGIDKQSVVNDRQQLRAVSEKITSRLKSDSLVEAYLPGREFSVAIMAREDSGNLEAMPIELVATADEYGRRILGQAAKAADTERVLPVTQYALKHKLHKLALDAFFALGGRDYGRIDIRLDAAGTPHFLEANLLPSLLDGYGNFPKACMLNMGLGYEDMLLRIVNLAFARQDDAETVLHASMPVTGAVMPLVDPPL